MARGGFALIEYAVIDDPALSVYDRGVYLVLLRFADREGKCFPSLSTIADRAGISRRKVMTCLKTLEEKAYLKRCVQQENSEFASTEYTLIPPVGRASHAPGGAPHALGVEHHMPYLGHTVPSNNIHSTRKEEVVEEEASFPSGANAPEEQENRARSRSLSLLEEEIPQETRAAATKKGPRLSPACTPSGGSAGEEHEARSPRKPLPEENGPAESAPQAQETRAAATAAKTDPREKAPQPAQKTLFDARKDFFDALVEGYHRILPELPRVKLFSRKRQHTTETRIREDPERKSLDWWWSYFERVRQCPYLLGTNSRGWKADFDWLLDEDRMTRVLEGKYDRRNGDRRKGGTAARLGGSERTAKQSVEDWAENVLREAFADILPPPQASEWSNHPGCPPGVADVPQEAQACRNVRTARNVRTSRNARTARKSAEDERDDMNNAMENVIDCEVVCYEHAL